MNDYGISKFLKVLLLLPFCFSCKKDAETINVPNSFEISNKIFQKVKTLEDKRANAELLELLKAGTPEEKFYSIGALASTQDSNAFQILVEILSQDQPDVIKEQTAFSLGQLSIEKPELEKLIEILPGQSSSVQLKIMEAIGKLGGPKELDHLCKYPDEGDNELVYGKALGVYRMGLRNLISRKSIGLMAEYLRERYPSAVRSISSNFFARVRSSDIMDRQEQLLSSLINDPDPVVRMNIATALAAGKGESTRSALLSKAIDDPDFRVRVNCFQSLRNAQFSLDSSDYYLVPELETLNERIAASEWITTCSKAEEIQLIRELVNRDLDWRVRDNLYRALLRHTPPKGKEAVVRDMERRIASSQNEFEKADLLRALSKYPPSHQLVFSYVGNRSLGIIVNSAAMGSLLSMTKEEEFLSSFSSEELDRILGSFAEYFKYGVLSGDPTMIGYGSIALRNEEIKWKDYLQETEFLEAAKQNLDLPAETETLYEIEKTIAFLKGEKFKKPEVKYSHPPNWVEIEENSKFRAATVKTNKGKFTIEFDWNSAPISVSNFISLSISGFYDGTRFHRVENNFVVQGGCPRGDGWGSPEYSIRSEFGQTYYGTGSVGMASAGKDTEGSQWFITHYPSNHLDGKYTNFGSVQEMEIVYQLEVGDTLISVDLITN